MSASVQEARSEDKKKGGQVVCLQLICLCLQAAFSVIMFLPTAQVFFFPSFPVMVMGFHMGGDGDVEDRKNSGLNIPLMLMDSATLGIVPPWGLSAFKRPRLSGNPSHTPIAHTIAHTHTPVT